MASLSKFQVLGIIVGLAILFLLFLDLSRPSGQFGEITSTTAVYSSTSVVAISSTVRYTLMPSTTRSTSTTIYTSTTRSTSTTTTSTTTTTLPCHEISHCEGDEVVSSLCCADRCSIGTRFRCIRPSVCCEYETPDTRWGTIRVAVCLPRSSCERIGGNVSGSTSTTTTATTVTVPSTVSPINCSMTALGCQGSCPPNMHCQYEYGLCLCEYTTTTTTLSCHEITHCEGNRLTFTQCCPTICSINASVNCSPLVCCEWMSPDTGIVDPIRIAGCTTRWWCDHVVHLF